MSAIMNLLMGDHDSRASDMQQQRQRQRSSSRPMSHRAKGGSDHTYCSIPIDDGVPSCAPPRGTPECKICW
jgi:hypothetical protein